MRTPWPFTTDSEWDKITIGGVAFSGAARVEDVGRERKVDVPKRSGADGAYLILQRRELAEPTIVLTGWTDAHMRELERIARAVFPTERSEQHNAVDVAHPALTFHGIDKVFVHAIEGPEVEKGRVILTLKTHQWRPPPPRSARRRPTTAATTPVAQRPTAFTGVEQPRPAAPAAAATPRRR